MTTAHRATYKAAKATFNGIEQGNYFTGGVGTTAVAARDLPGQKSLKRRMIGQGTEEELGSKELVPKQAQIQPGFYTSWPSSLRVHDDGAWSCERATLAG